MAAIEGPFVPLVTTLTSAAAAVAAVFGLFGSFLADLVPPFEDSQQTVAFASFGTAIVLLALSLVIRSRVTQVQTRVIASIAIVLFIVAVGIYLPFHDYARTHIYRFPPASSPQARQARYVRGELHDLGRQRVGEKTIAQTVYELGGPDQVDAMGTLWHEDSRLKTIATLERYYIALIVTLTSAIFAAGLTATRQLRGGGRPQAPTE